MSDKFIFIAVALQKKLLQPVILTAQHGLGSGAPQNFRRMAPTEDTFRGIISHSVYLRRVMLLKVLLFWRGAVRYARFAHSYSAFSMLD